MTKTGAVTRAHRHSLQQQGNFQLRHTGWRIEHSAVMRKQDKKKGKRHAAQDQLFVSFIFMN